MPQRINVPGIGEVEFPDGMSDAQIAQAIRKNMPQGNSIAQGAQSLANETGAWESVPIAAGRAVDKMAMGLKQATLGAVQKMGSGSFAQAAAEELRKLKQDEAEKDVAYGALEKAHPWATAIGGGLPTAAAAVAGGSGYVAPALISALTEGVKYGSPQERMRSGATAALASMAGTALGGAVGSMASPVASSKVPAARQEAMQSAERIGYKPRMSEVNGSPFWARQEDFAARAPGGAGVMQDFAQANQEAVNRAAASSIGENATSMSPSVFSQARQRIVQPFEDIKALGGKPIQITPSVGKVADDIIATQGKMIPAERDAALMELAQQAKMLAQNAGKIDGETYQLTRSGLSNQAWEASGTNKALYGKLLSALDDAAEQSLRSSGNTALAEALKVSRPQYKNLMTLEKGMVAQAGNVSPAKVAQALRTANPAAFREGAMASNPLYDIGVIGEHLKPLAPGSPTFERNLSASLADMLITAPRAYGTAKLTTSGIPTGYMQFLAQNPGASKVAEGAAQLSTPAARALAAALAQRSAPVMFPVAAEQ